MTDKVKTATEGEVRSNSTTDRIEKQLVINAPRARVWRAIADSKEFGTWFRVRLDEAFAEGKTIKGQITNPGYEHFNMEMQVVRIEAESYFAYRWHPFAGDRTRDYSTETPTLVEFFLEDAGAGTNLTIVESGFDKLPADRRAEAFRMNDGGWGGQIRNIAKHVASTHVASTHGASAHVAP